MKARLVAFLLATTVLAGSALAGTARAATYAVMRVDSLSTALGPCNYGVSNGSVAPRLGLDMVGTETVPTHQVLDVTNDQAVMNAGQDLSLPDGRNLLWVASNPDDPIGSYNADDDMSGANENAGGCDATVQGLADLAQLHPSDRVDMSIAPDVNIISAGWWYFGQVMLTPPPLTSAVAQRSTPWNVKLHSLGSTDRAVVVGQATSRQVRDRATRAREDPARSSLGVERPQR